MNPLAIPTAHGHIAPTVWATPRIAALPERAASARESARGGGPGVGPLRRVRHTEPGIRCVAHLRLSALGPVDRRAAARVVEPSHGVSISNIIVNITNRSCAMGY